MDVFTRIFNEKNHKISIYDIDTGKTKDLSEKYNCNVSNSLNELCQISDTVILCTPLKETPNIINQIIKYANLDTLVVEISSLKKKKHRCPQTIQE